MNSIPTSTSPSSSSQVADYFIVIGLSCLHKPPLWQEIRNKQRKKFEKFYEENKNLFLNLKKNETILKRFLSLQASNSLISSSFHEEIHPELISPYLSPLELNEDDLLQSISSSTSSFSIFDLKFEASVLDRYPHGNFYQRFSQASLKPFSSFNIPRNRVNLENFLSILSKMENNLVILLTESEREGNLLYNLIKKISKDYEEGIEIGSEEIKEIEDENYEDINIDKVIEILKLNKELEDIVNNQQIFNEEYSETFYSKLNIIIENLYQKKKSEEKFPFISNITSPRNLLYPLPPPPDPYFPEGIEYFIFPKGGIRIRKKMKKPKYHSFFHTDANGKKKIGCALTFTEIIEEEERISLYKQLKEYHIFSSTNSSVSKDLPQPLNSPTYSSPLDILLDFKIKLYIDKSICLVSPHSFVLPFKKFLNSIYKISLLSSLFPSRDYNHWNTIEQIDDEGNEDLSSCWGCRLVPYERHICNFIDDIPLPPPGKVEVVYYLTSTFPTNSIKNKRKCKNCAFTISSTITCDDDSSQLFPISDLENSHPNSSGLSSETSLQVGKDAELLVRMASMNFENENSIIAPGITIPSKMARTTSPVTSPNSSTASFFPPPILEPSSSDKISPSISRTPKILSPSTFKTLTFEEKIHYIKSVQEKQLFLHIPLYTSFIDEQNLTKEYEKAYKEFKETEEVGRIKKGKINEEKIKFQKIFSFLSLDSEIKFRLPPINEPHFGEGNIPLHPLFECLSAENICKLFLLLTLEKQIVLISSQYNLLTLCSEAAISLLYPLKWCYAYIPVLPVKLLGALGAPFPFFFGIHSDIYEENKQSLISTYSSEIVYVFLDEDRLENFPENLPQPERRYNKLLQHINKIIPWYSEENVLRMLGLKSDIMKFPAEKDKEKEKTKEKEKEINKINNSVANFSSSTSLSFSSLPYKLNIKNEKSEGLKYWQQYRRPLYDLAFSSAIDTPMEIYCSSLNNNQVENYEIENDEYNLNQLKNLLNIKDNTSFVSSPVYILDESQIREGFLKFFVSILLDYKKYLVYTPYIPTYENFPPCSLSLNSLIKIENPSVSPTLSLDNSSEGSLSPSNSTPSSPIVSSSSTFYKPVEKFRFNDFLQNSPSEWTNYLSEFIRSQSFSLFVEERVMLTKLDKNVLFFDESIDAKQNRYLFHTTKIDTPFLNLHQEIIEEQSKQLSFLQHQLQLQLHQYHLQVQNKLSNSNLSDTSFLSIPTPTPISLSYQNYIYTKSYVPPTPQINDLLSLDELVGDKDFENKERKRKQKSIEVSNSQKKEIKSSIYFKLREFNPNLLVLPRNLAATFNLSLSPDDSSSTSISSPSISYVSTSDEVLKLFTQVRMKRKIKAKENKDKKKEKKSSSDSSEEFALLPSTSTGCVFSSYLISLAQQLLRVSERNLEERRNGNWKHLSGLSTSYLRKINEILFMKSSHTSLSFSSPPISPHISRRFSVNYDNREQHLQLLDYTKYSINYILKNIMIKYEDYHNLLLVEECILSLLHHISSSLLYEKNKNSSLNIKESYQIDLIDKSCLVSYETILYSIQASQNGVSHLSSTFSSFFESSKCLYTTLPSHSSTFYINTLSHIMNLLSILLNYLTNLTLYTHNNNQQIISSLYLSTQVLIEVFNILIKMDYLPEENVYRYLTECFSSCACTIGSSSLIRVIIDLMIFMDSEGYLPDHQIRYSLLRAMTTAIYDEDNSSSSASSSTTPLNTMVNTSLLQDLHEIIHFANFISQSMQEKYVRFINFLQTNYNINFDTNSNSSSTTTSIPFSSSAQVSSPDPSLKEELSSSFLLSLLSASRKSFPNSSREYIKRYRQLEKLLGVKSSEDTIQKMIINKQKNNAIEINIGTLKLTPYDVWNLTNWSNFRKQKLNEIQMLFSSSSLSSLSSTSSFSSILLRAVIQPQPGGMIRFNDYEANSLSRMFFGGSSSLINDIATLSDLEEQNDILFKKAMFAELLKKHEKKKKSNSSSTSKNSCSSSPPPLAYRWSVNPIEGVIPHLHWNNFDSNSSNFYSICKRLRRQVKIGEDLLRTLFHDLSIDFSEISCPNRTCPLHSLSFTGLFAMLALKWERDAHKYTVKCIKCNKTFVPRFSVNYSLVEKEKKFDVGDLNKTISPTSINSTSDSNEAHSDCVKSNSISSSSLFEENSSRIQLWKEFLSPYTLYKELMNLLNDSTTNNSIEDLTNLNTIFLNAHSNANSHRNTLFWNLIIHFRLRGLPYGFLLSQGNILKAFPQRDRENSEE